MKLFPKWKEQKLWQKFANVFALIFLAACLLIIIFFYGDAGFGIISFIFLISALSLAPYDIAYETISQFGQNFSTIFYFDHNLSTMKALESIMSEKLLFIIVPIIGLITYYLIGALTGLFVGKIKDKIKNKQVFAALLLITIAIIIIAIYLIYFLRFFL